MHSWFKYFDQNLKGLDGTEDKLYLYGAFQTMANQGVLLPPFNLGPHDKDQKTIKGVTQLKEYSRIFGDQDRFKRRVAEYVEAKKAKERPKSAPGRREVKTTVTNKKVIDE